MIRGLGRTGLEAPVLGWCPFQRRLFHGGAALAEAAPAWKRRCWAGISSQRRLFHGGAALAEAAPAWKRRCWAGISSQRRLFHGGAAPFA